MQDQQTTTQHSYVDRAEIMSALCLLISEGLSLRTACQQPGMPTKTTVLRWLGEQTEEAKVYRDQYARAKKEGIEALADELTDIADDGRNDWMERLDKDGQGLGWVINGEHVQRSRLRVDTRKWLLSKLAPKKYGDKVEQTLVGPDGGPVQTVVRHRIEFVEPPKRADD